MGGRGTFAKGNNVPFTYKTIGQLYKQKFCKVLAGCTVFRRKLIQAVHI